MGHAGESASDRTLSVVKTLQDLVGMPSTDLDHLARSMELVERTDIPRDLDDNVRRKIGDLGLCQRIGNDIDRLRNDIHHSRGRLCRTIEPLPEVIDELRDPLAVLGTVAVVRDAPRDVDLDRPALTFPYRPAAA